MTIKATKNKLNYEINRYLKGTPGAPPVPGNVRGRMQLPRNGKINGAVVSNSSGRNFSAGNVYKIGTNFYAASTNRNGANIWVPARRADRFNPLSKRFIKMMVTTPFNKVVNANGKITFVPRGETAGNKAVLVPNARLTGANKVYKYNNLFYARAVANAEGRPINGRRPNVFYRVNRGANGSFAFSTNANVRNLTYVMANNKFIPEPSAGNLTRQKFNAFVKQQLARTNLTGNNKAKGQAILNAWKANANLSTLSKSNNNAGRAANWSNKALHNYMWRINQANRNNIAANANRTGQTERGVWPPFPIGGAATGPNTGTRNTSANVAKFLTWYTNPNKNAMRSNNNSMAAAYVARLKGTTNNKNSVGGGYVTGNINKNASRAAFWTAVNREMARRA
jgi:hypothetical protein